MLPNSQSRRLRKVTKLTKPERAQFIHTKIRSALRAIQNDPRYDWNRDFSDAIGTAAETLGKALLKFVDGKADEDTVKDTYKKYVAMYAR